MNYNTPAIDDFYMSETARLIRAINAIVAGHKKLSCDIFNEIHKVAKKQHLDTTYNFESRTFHVIYPQGAVPTIVDWPLVSLYDGFTRIVIER